MKDIFAPNQRLILLQAMHGDNDFSLSNEMLQRVLVQMGHGVDLEKTNKEINWLKDNKLVTIESIDKTLKVVKLTRSGIDAAQGYLRLEGLDRPRPE